MENQKLTYITRGLQHAAAETNSMVADQYIRILSQYFDHLEDGTLQAKMVRVQLDDTHHAQVPLVALVAPTGLALDRMRVELSIRMEGADDQPQSVLNRLRHVVRDQGDEDAARSDFTVSLSPRSKSREGSRQSDHVHIDLEFKAIETPEAVMRVIDAYANMFTPIRTPEPEETAEPEDGAALEPEPNEE